jgi:4-amino-4-deoxy-L-arabinose transferase-like glycosyltransferase
MKSVPNPADDTKSDQDGETTTILDRIRRKATPLDPLQAILLIILLVSIVLKIALTINFAPFGIATKSGSILNAARMLGYTGINFDLTEWTTFIGPYLASIVLRLHLPIETYFYIKAAGSMIVPILAYYLVKEISGSQTALLTMVLASVNWHWVFWTYYRTGETRQVMLGIIALYLLHRGIKDSSRNYLFSLSGTLFALAFHTKIQVVALTLPILTLLYYEREKLRRDSIPLFLLAFTTMMLILAPISQSYVYLTYLTQEQTQRDSAINPSGLIRYLYENLQRIPYEISIPTTAFIIYGLYTLVKETRSQKDLYITWLASYFILYAFISQSLQKNLGYYSQNWTIPLLILAATGMQRLLQHQKSMRNQLLVLIATLSTSVEGPLPLIRLTTRIPFIALKDNLACYRRLVAQIPPSTEQGRLFYETMSNFVPKTYIIPEDIALLTGTLLPLTVSLLTRSKLLDSKTKQPQKKT